MKNGLKSNVIAELWQSEEQKQYEKRKSEKSLQKGEMKVLIKNNITSMKSQWFNLVSTYKDLNYCVIKFRRKRL